MNTRVPIKTKQRDGKGGQGGRGTCDGGRCSPAAGWLWAPWT